LPKKFYEIIVDVKVIFDNGKNSEDGKGVLLGAVACKVRG
jgi:hypothetical protein